MSPEFEYTYDVLGRMKEVRQRDAAACGGGSSTVMAEYTYDDLSRVTAITRVNGAGTSASYNSSSQSWSLSQNLASTGQDVTFGMTYTPSSQVLTRSIDNAAYQYAATSSANTYCSNGLNQYAKVENSSSACSGGQAYTYDGRGNLLSDGPRTFVYDLENKLTRVTGPGSSGTPTDWNTANWNAFQWSGATTTYLGYDPQGRLRQTDAAAGTKQYLYDGDALLVEYDAGGVVLRRYVPGQGVDETLVWYEGANFATPNWLHTDQQGSVVAASNSAGVSAATYAYGPYGEPMGGFASGGPAFRYTGQVQLPAHNLYYYKARMYDPNLGRFLQTDPIGYDAGLNLYAYVENDPSNKTDPTGMDYSFSVRCYESRKVYGHADGSISTDEEWKFAGCDAFAPLDNFLAAAGQFLWGLIPGSDAADCIRSSCSAIGWGYSAAMLLPPAKVARFPKLTGQLHHAISRPVHKALGESENLRGIYQARDPRFVTQGRDLAAHRGYDSFHRNLDAEISNWIRSNPNATPAQFETYLRGVYQRPDVLQRFPNGL